MSDIVAINGTVKCICRDGVRKTRSGSQTKEPLQGWQKAGGKATPVKAIGEKNCSKKSGSQAKREKSEKDRKAKELR